MLLAGKKKLIRNISGIPTDGLIAYWSFSGNTEDSIGSNDFTNNGATLTSDKDGNSNEAYSFDGANDYMSLSSTYNIGTIHSISFRVKFSKTVCDFLRATNRLSTLYFPSLNQISYRCGISTFSQVDFSETDIIIMDGTTYFDVVFTRNGTTVNLYLNAVSKQSPKTLSNNYDFVINLLGATATWPLGGVVDNIRIYNRVLSSSEIIALHNE